MFLHPFLAILGTALVAVPIVIHLLNRRRFQVVRWGAMAFLLAAYKKTRRRLELESLLLLLLRALAVLLVALALARPILTPDSPLAVATGGPREVIVALDASWSMSFREGSFTNFERAVQATRGILDALRPERQDKAVLILAKRRPKVVSAGSPSAARDALARITEPSFEDMDLAATFDLAASELDALRPGDAPVEAAPARDAARGDGVKSAGPPVHLYFVTDLQKTSFFPRGNRETRDVDATPAAGAPPPVSALQAAASTLAARNVQLRLVDVGTGGDGPVENAGIVDVRAADDLPAAGVPIELRVAVKNFGASARANVIVQATVDGNRESPQTISTLAPSSVQEVGFSLTFRDAGDHAVEIAIDEDRCGVDDRRAFSLTVRPPVRVLLVDGAPDPDPELASAGMLSLALAVPEELAAVSPFRLIENQAVDRVKFASQPELLEQADVVLLVNVEGVSEDQAARLTEYCAAGGCLIFVLGDRVDPASYSSRLRAGADPKGWLFPGILTGIREVPSREHPPWRIGTLADPVPPHLRFFEPAERRVLLTEVPVYRFQGIDVGDADVAAGARVLARFDDGEQSPFLVTKDLGRGRVAVLTTALDASPDRRWSRIAESPKTFLPLLFDLLHAMTSGSPDPRNVRVGETLRAEVRGAPRQASITDPSGRVERLDTGKPRKLGADRFVLESAAPVERPGLYALEVESAVGVGAVSTTSVKFGVAVVAEEGDLTRLSPASAAAAIPGLEVKLASGIEEEARPEPGGGKGDLWKSLVLAALAVLALESALATWFGRRRA